MSIRLSLLSAKKPTDRLSGDQKGFCAPLVPVSGRASTESSTRSHNRDWPSEVPTKTMVCPSGEIASDAGAVVGGVLISRRTSGVGGTGRKARTIAMAAISVMSARVEINAARSRRRDALYTGWPSICGPVSASSISRRASPMSRWRTFVSFCKQRRSKRRMPSGVSAGSLRQSGSTFSHCQRESRQPFRPQTPPAR